MSQTYTKIKFDETVKIGSGYGTRNCVKFVLTGSMACEYVMLWTEATAFETDLKRQGYTCSKVQKLIRRGMSRTPELVDCK